jgi:predicted amidophosphoribosyltransferase
VLQEIATIAVPPLCAACGASCPASAVVCGGCASGLGAAGCLTGDPPGGVDRCWSSAPYEGVARRLVGALKFRRLLPVAGLMAERIALIAPPGALAGAVVPVPPAPLRSRLRGFDPAAEISRRLAGLTQMPVRDCLRRRGGGRQVGRGRAQRVGAPPRISAAAPAPEIAVLVDDVLTTGATLSACAAALRAAGSREVGAVTFVRRL